MAGPSCPPRAPHRCHSRFADRPGSRCRRWCPSRRRWPGLCRPERAGRSTRRGSSGVPSVPSARVTSLRFPPRRCFRCAAGRAGADPGRRPVDVPCSRWWKLLRGIRLNMRELDLPPPISESKVTPAQAHDLAVPEAGERRQHNQAIAGMDGLSQGEHLRQGRYWSLVGLVLACTLDVARVSSDAAVLHGRARTTCRNR